MSFRGMLTDTANLLIKESTNQGGRVNDVWSVSESFPCRFTSPNTSKIPVAEVGEIHRVDSVVFAEISFLELLGDVNLPIRITTESNEWGGTYELHKPPRVYSATKRVSHVELDVTRVEQ